MGAEFYRRLMLTLVLEQKVLGNPMVQLKNIELLLHLRVGGYIWVWNGAITIQMSSCLDSIEFLDTSAYGCPERNHRGGWVWHLEEKGSQSFARGGIIPHPDGRSVQEGEDHRCLQVPYTMDSSFAERKNRIGEDGGGNWMRDVAYWKAIKATNIAPMQKEAWGRRTCWQRMKPHWEKKAMTLYRKKAFGREYAKAAPCIPKYLDRIASR